MAKKMLRFYEWYCKKFGNFLKSQPSQELDFSVRFLELDVQPQQIIGAAKFTMILGFMLIILFSVISFFAGVNTLTYIFLSPLAIVFFFIITEWPKSLAKQKADKSLSSAPYIITQIAVTLKQAPNMESALAFVSQNSSNKIAREMRDILFNAWAGNIQSVYKETLKLADRWAKFSLGFQRSIHLILSSFYEKTKKSKEQTLDMAVDTMLSDITSTMHSYSASLHIPTLVIFSVGTILPLMIISLFPIISFFGFQTSQLTIGGFLGFTLLATYLYSNSTLRKRPVGFPLAKVKTKEKNKWKSAAILVFVLSTLPTALFLLNQFGAKFSLWQISFLNIIGPYSIVWGIGLALSLHFYGSYSEKKKLRTKIKKLEDQFTDSLYHIKNRLKEGQPMESAVDFAAKMLKNLEIGDYFSKILDRMHTGNITLEASIKENKTGSAVIDSTLKLLSNSMKLGRTAIMQTADVVYTYLKRIRKIEKNVNIMLSKTLGMIKATIMLFAPVICAVIVVLFQMINTTIKNVKVSNPEYDLGTLFVVSSVTPEILQIVVGLYLIALNYILMRYVSYVQNGFDKAILRYELSKSIPLTLAIFTATLIITRSLLLKV